MQLNAEMNACANSTETNESTAPVVTVKKVPRRCRRCCVRYIELLRFSTGVNPLPLISPHVFVPAARAQILLLHLIQQRSYAQLLSACNLPTCDHWCCSLVTKKYFNWCVPNPSTLPEINENDPCAQQRREYLTLFNNAIVLLQQSLSTLSYKENVTVH